MSDNPADSLRRELEAAIDGARLHVFWPTSMPKAAVDATWPLIRAALEAARADERERLQRENQEAVKLLNYALHLRMYGENAPGGNETWREFDGNCERFLRARPIRAVSDGN